jgi:hypothetical protein
MQHNEAIETMCRAWAGECWPDASDGMKDDCRRHIMLAARALAGHFASTGDDITAHAIRCAVDVE